ncbi:MAG: hypothetical protein ACR2JY_17045 [Chloroflexota bacterium]
MATQQLPFGSRSAPLPLTLVVGDAYIHVEGNPRDRKSLVIVAHELQDLLNLWATQA